MTESEVLKKLEEYSKYIITLQNKVASLEKERDMLTKAISEMSVLKKELELKVEELSKPKPKKRKSATPIKKKEVEIPVGDGKTITVTNVPVEPKVEEPNHKIVVKSAEKELAEMIGES